MENPLFRVQRPNTSPRGFVRGRRVVVRLPNLRELTAKSINKVSRTAPRYNNSALEHHEVEIKVINAIVCEIIQVWNTWFTIPLFS
jgi:hypothetical protein